MAPFYSVYPRRTDGSLQNSKAGSLKASKELNEPTAAQLDSKPNAQGVSDYYRLCEPGHGKEMDWRRKLGGMLVRELGGSAELQDKNFILSAFPENYRLYEHVRTRASNANGPTKSHAAGGNDRQDSYLYGHPHGRKKRYRSPADFFPHLLWLSTDDTGDPNNCSCRICSPEELELDDDADAKATAKAGAQAKITNAPFKAASVQSDVPQSARRPSQSTSAVSSLPRLKSYEQRLDNQYDGFYYRPGEVVWFQRAQAWGLGTVASRSLRPPPSSTRPTERRYRIQPLGHPFGFSQPVECSQDQVRNWLTYSPPPCLNPDLHPTPQNGLKQSTFEGVDWRAYIQNPKRTTTDAEVDSSILAAKMVETTYTPFDLAESKTSTGASLQVSERYYNGLFLGAEKIWLGDPLRLRGKDNATTTDILVLHKLLERQHPGDSSRSALVLQGDVYQPITVPSNTLAATSPLLPANLSPLLPVRLKDDLAARNQLAQSSPNPTIRAQTHTFKLTQSSIFKETSDIKGRWYESSLLMPVLNPEEYNTKKRHGELTDCTLWMNGHGDCNKHPSGSPSYRAAWVRCKKREDAFGRSVPKSFSIATQEKESDGQVAARSTSAKAPTTLGRPPQSTQGQSQGQLHQQTVQTQAAQAMTTPLVNRPPYLNKSAPSQNQAPTFTGPHTPAPQQSRNAQTLSQNQQQQQSQYPNGQPQATPTLIQQHQQRMQQLQQAQLAQRLVAQQSQAQNNDSVQHTQNQGQSAQVQNQQQKPQGGAESDQPELQAQSAKIGTVHTAVSNFDDFMDFDGGDGGADSRMSGI